MPDLRPGIRVLRDIKTRKGVKENEILRRAYLYVARNESLPPNVRHQAQLQLNSFGRYTRPSAVVNRCAETGRGQGIMSEFALCRVCYARLFHRVYYAERMPVSIPAQGIEQRNPWSSQSFVVTRFAQIFARVSISYIFYPRECI